MKSGPANSPCPKRREGGGKKKKRECKTSITKASPNSNSTVLFSVDFQNTVLTGTNKNRNIAGDHGEQSN